SRRLIEQGAVEQIELQRVMQAAASNMVLADPDLAGIRVMDRARRRREGTIDGVQGNELNRRPTEFDHTEGMLTRKNDYLYADLLDESGQMTASTSPARAASEFEDTINKVAAGTMVFYVAEGHEEAKKLSLVKVDFAKRVGQVVDGPVVSRGLVALAAFNLFVEAQMVWKARNSNPEYVLLGMAKPFAGSLSDLIAASLKMSQVLGAQNADLKGPTRFYRIATRPLFDVKNWFFIGNRLTRVRAQTLVRTVGLASFVAGAVGIVLSGWEMRICLSNKDFDSAAGHAIALVGGLVFVSSPLMATLLAIPGWGWAILGMGMIVGGNLYAGQVADDEFTKLLKRCPLGTYPSDAAGDESGEAFYSQLLSLLSPIHVTAQKYRDITPDPELSHPEYLPDGDDYVITVRFPLIGRLRLNHEPRANLPANPLNVVVQEVAYSSSSTDIPVTGVFESVTNLRLLKATPLKKITARRSLPDQSAVQFLVKREFQDCDYKSLFYEESVTTRVRVGIQATIDTEIGPLVFPAPVFENYEPFDVSRHSSPPPKARKIFDQYGQPDSPYWYFTEVAT
ncbi:MAG: hypothetical protein R6W86_13085, partial [Marinobacter sp.]|uniref:hypothetical protein n=1 Tax=Marinobacter sp. TaxID=50741 RepID=UPI00396D22F1